MLFLCRLMHPRAMATQAMEVSKLPSCGCSHCYLRRIPADKLHVSKPTWWLESRFHFSFADYYNPANQKFGALRVLNDDLVKPHAGFGSHPHRDAEIFSYVVDGELSHKDSMGNKEALGRGSVQYLSAGSGMVHSEMNDGDATTRFLQVWLTPDRRGVDPQYGSKTFAPADRHNKLLHLLSGNTQPPQWENVNPAAADVRIHQDAHVYVSENDAGVDHKIVLAPKRQAYLVCIEGSLDICNAPLKERDAVEIANRSDTDPFQLTLKTGDKGSHFLVIEMQRA